jgi:hypothetical protein
LVVVLLFNVNVNFVSQQSTITSNVSSSSSSTTTESTTPLLRNEKQRSKSMTQPQLIQPQSTKPRPKPKQKPTTMPPQSSNPNMAGFIHIGKTGGSSISKLLKNGCSSFASNGNKEGCNHLIDNETIVSRLVERYYHVADFWRLPETHHRRFLISIRDVYDRTVSALLYLHPDNLKYYQVPGLTDKQKYFGPLAYQCFPTLEEFATLLRGRPGSSRTPDDCNYPYPPKMVEVGDCSALACATVHGKVRFFSHLFFNYRNILNTKLTLTVSRPSPPSEEQQRQTTKVISTLSTNNTSPLQAIATTELQPPQLYVIRQEHLWDDWIEVNRLWGQPTDEPVLIPAKGDMIHQRNVSSLALPVSRSVSEEGRHSICIALGLEYEAYFRLLVQAVNIDENDINDCRQIAQRNCPNLNIDSILATARQKSKSRGV